MVTIREMEMRREAMERYEEGMRKREEVMLQKVHEAEERAQ